MSRKNDEMTYCDFCKLPKGEVNHLIEGPGANGNGREEGRDSVYICPGCIAICSAMLDKQGLMPTPPEPEPDQLPDLVVPDPREIKKYLDLHIIGQTHAKRVLAVAVANHYKRLMVVGDVGDELKDVRIDKSNVLMVGPTGSGKTLLARTLADLLGVPFAIGDATTITEAGYVGEDVENLLLKLIRNANGNVKAAERGILFIDEIDKVGRTTSNVSLTRDVSGEGVQQALLKMLEGTIANVPPQGGRKHPDAEYVPFDTTNVLFICGGTFVGLLDIVSKRVGGKGMGFHHLSVQEQSDDNILAQVTTDDLVEFGMIPEFVGRLPVITTLEGLTEDILVRVLTEPQDALIKQYQKICKIDGVTLKFEDEAVREIAKKALERDTGARALRGVVEEIMLDLMFDIADYKDKGLVITGEMVRRKKAA